MQAASSATPSTFTSGHVTSSANLETPSTPEPYSAIEDPYLVGEAAASRARSARLYREKCLRGEEGLRYEERSWNFMVAQMADWEERDRCWRRFKDVAGGIGMGRKGWALRRLGSRV
jgi:hypothetical protein